MSLEDVRSGLRDAFKAVNPKWHTYGVWSDITQLPAILVVPNFGADDGTPPGNYGTDFSGSVRWTLKVILLVETGDMASADRTLSSMVSPDKPLSVPAILDVRRNREIAGAGINYVLCKELSTYGKEYPVAGTVAISAEFKLEVEEE